ncbi:hypothetical protein L798_13086 [Zootermopsis nevadensis]|uniref:Uncharacterized protein n=3 Tax=Zootermopsis nevadensis TaxID=136037 RepID=A0A067RSN9_ZOONE|nr:hypothetical protein L798_13086 [Zootermopsis nevadensis]
MPSIKKQYEQHSSENQGSPSWMQPSTSRHARDVSTEEIEMDELFNHRTQVQEKEYTPLEMKDILERERRERIRAWWTDHLRDFLTFFIYLITLYCAVFGSRDDMAYYSTSSIKNTIVYSDIFSEITSTKV